MALETELRARSQAHPIPFRSFMESALYDPEEGYYQRRRDRIGTSLDADFATSPVLGSFLGQALWSMVAHLQDPTIVEIGAGTGALARSILDHAKRSGRTPRYVVVDRSADQLRQSGLELEALPLEQAPVADLVIAHELFDAIPIDLLRRRHGRTERLAYQNGQPTTLDVEGVTVPPEVLDGQWFPDPRPQQDLLRTLATRTRGHLVVIDYGTQQRHHWNRRGIEPVRTYRNQQDAGPWWTEPGTKDITFDVDFPSLLDALPPGQVQLRTQEEWLLEQGILDALNAIDRSTVEGAKAYLQLRQTLLPTGMGHRFHVLEWHPSEPLSS